MLFRSMTIGQDIEMDICIPEDGVANNHASVEAIKQSESYLYMIKSRENKPLVELNGENITQAELKDGDWLIIGGVEFQFTDDGVNKIKEKTVAAAMTTKKSTPQRVVQENEESEALKLIKEIKEEVKSMTTKEFIEDSHFSRRLNIF